jgi:hypothetical protein
MGSTTNFNQANILKACVAQNKLPVFSTHYITSEGMLKGLVNCGTSGSNNTFCTKGANFVRQNRDYILSRYNYLAANIASIIGKQGNILLKIEANFSQYYTSQVQQSGPLTGQYMRALFDDICKTVRAQLPNAAFSWEITPEMSQDAMRTYWAYFQSSPYISYTHTLGDQIRADSFNIRDNQLTWSFMNQLTNKKIIADCTTLSDCQQWANFGNMVKRLKDRVTSLTQDQAPIKPTLKPKIYCSTAEAAYKTPSVTP